MSRLQLDSTFRPQVDLPGRQPSSHFPTPIALSSRTPFGTSNPPWQLPAFSSAGEWGWGGVSRLWSQDAVACSNSAVLFPFSKRYPKSTPPSWSNKEISSHNKTLMAGGEPSCFQTRQQFRVGFFMQMTPAGAREFCWLCCCASSCLHLAGNLAPVACTLRRLGPCLMLWFPGDC